MPLILEDSRARDIRQVKQIFTEGYWPAPTPRDLYRPLTSLLLSVEWQLGGGAASSFKAVQVGLYAASAIAVLILALQLLPFWGAVVAALFFAVHPVHVEAVALGVNQAEVIVGLLSALAVAWYIARRRAGVPGWGAAAGLGLTTFIAAHFKETGVMIAGLLVAAELLAVGATAPGRWRATRPVWLLQILAVELVVVIRSFIQPDRLSGTYTAEAFTGSSMWNRLETMLTVVPEWLRLHLWPATLQADYSPRVIVQATGWGGAQWLGLAIVGMIVFLAFRIRSRAPVVLFGVAWVAIGLFPVSNVLIPTGITMAERTLFLSSIGAMLAVAAFGVEAIREIAERHRIVVQRILIGAVIVITLLGASRSLSRHRIWRSSLSMWAQTVVDAPESYRAWIAFGTLPVFHDVAGARHSGLSHRTRALRPVSRANAPTRRVVSHARRMPAGDPALHQGAHLCGICASIDEPDCLPGLGGRLPCGAAGRVAGDEDRVLWRALPRLVPDGTRRRAQQRAGAHRALPQGTRLPLRTTGGKSGGARAGCEAGREGSYLRCHTTVR